MRKLIILITLLSTSVLVQSQNVGIGTASPAYPLTVQANSNGIVQTNGTVKVGLYLSNANGAWLQTLSNHNLNFATNDAFQPQVTLTTNGNFGIGTVSPAYKLDIEGRMRLQQSGVNTAGIWFDGPANETRSFLGTIDNDHVGIYGNGGAGWKFSFNVNNGNVGVGTSAPTANLDVNGSIRMRGTSPKKGSVMTSDDVNGNANWADPIAFKATGGYDGAATPMTRNAWVKVLFNQTLSYNAGLGFQPINSQFVVPENGIYHFDTQIHWENLHQTSSVRIRINRGGNIFTAAESYKLESQDLGNGLLRFQHPSALSTDISLVAGDIVWVEGYYYIYYVSSNSISANSVYTWFSGHLVARQ